MKSKKAGLFCVIMLSMSTFFGCAGTITLNEEEHNLIARYAAGTLLNYSADYEGRLDMAAEGQAASQAPTAVPVAAEQPVTSEQPDISHNSDGTEASSEPEIITKAELNDIYNIPGLTFSYNSYEFCSEYPRKSSAAQVFADNGGILLVVKFNIKNTANKKLSVNLIERNEITYSLKADNDFYKPQMSMLENGLNFYKTSIKAGNTKEAVLIYSLPRKAKESAGITLNVQETEKAGQQKVIKEAVILLK